MRILHLYIILAFLCWVMVKADEIDKFRKNFEPIHVGDKDKKKKEIKSELLGVHKIAVLPFSDLTKKNREPAEMFSDKMASQLVETKMFDVKYPKEAIAAILDLGIHGELADFDSSQLKQIGKKLKVEALVIGEIKEVNLYEPVRISFVMRMFIVEENRFGSTEEIWDLSSYGLPIDYVSKKDKEKFSRVWAPQNVYDSSSIALQRDIKRYCKDRNYSEHAFGWKYVIQSNERYLEFITYDVCEKLKVAIDPKYQKKDGLWYRLRYALR